VQPSAELTVRVHAASIPDLDEGCFTLHVLGVSRAAGTAAGRFLNLLDAADRERMRGAYATLPGVHGNSLLAQVSAVPRYAKSENVGRAPQVTRLLISLGEHRDVGGADQVPVSDLAVTADARRLHLVSLSRRRPVHTVLPSAVDLTIHTHPLARFLLEAPVALAAPCTAFDWGAASALPFVPALRYRRTVISPARWMLTATDLPGKDASWPFWDDALTAWTSQVGLPRHVRAGDGDRCLTLDLAEPSHRALLRAEVGRVGRATLRTAPRPGDLGWAGGHPHEITIPLAATGPAVAPVRWRGEVTRRGLGHMPGRDGRLYLKLYVSRDLQDAVLIRHLPELAARLGGQVLWWFIRYDDPEPHLRLRLTVGTREFGPAAELAGAWTSQLRDAGLITRVSWETYYPETARFGGTAVMDAAEEFFAADSGDRAGVLITRVPFPAKTPSNAMVSLPSRSRLRNLNLLARSPRPMRRLRACWAVQAPVGWAVMPRTCTVLVRISMTKKTHTRRSSTVSTCRKSQARMPDAWLARNCRQVGEAPRGAGPRPTAARIRRIVPSPTRCPSPISSPWMRLYPQRGFCRASCSTSARTPAGTGGRPGAPGIGPFLPHQAPVSGQQGAWHHDPVQPQAPGQQPGEGGDHGTVSPVRSRARHLTPQRGDLTPEDQDLHVLGSVTAGQ
jgi:hypothetical protein